MSRPLCTHGERDNWDVEKTDISCADVDKMAALCGDKDEMDMHVWDDDENDMPCTDIVKNDAHGCDNDHWACALLAAVFAEDAS